MSRHWLNWTLVVWLGVCAWFLWSKSGAIQWLALGDTDDNMRLMQVRALLAGQGWYDLTNYRLDPALGGLNIHWSRFVDLPIAGLILLLKPFIGMTAAEKWACGIAPLLPLAITMPMLSLTVRRLVAPALWPVAIVILVASCAAAMSMYAPLRIDHHGWQLACLATTVAGLTDPRRARGGLIVGASSALSLVIGLELLPYCAMAGAIIGLRWVWDEGEARRMQVYGASLAGVSALGFALFASNANQAMRCDALTPVWLSTVMVAGLFLFVLAFTKPEKLWMRLVLGALAGAVIAGGFATLFPQCVQGRPEGVSDELARIWLNNVREARPIYRQPMSGQIAMATLPVIGMIGAFVAAWLARKSDKAAGWATIALFSAFACATMLWQVRTGPAAQVLGVPGATALVWLIVPWCLNNRRMLVRVLGSVAAFVLVTGIFAVFVIKWLPQDKPNPGSARVNQANSDCARLTSMAMLNTIPAATMFTHVDLGPRLVTMTHHNGIAGPYHRNERQILDVHHAFMGTREQFRPIAKAHKAAYVLICPNLAETTLYRSRSKDGFYAQLHRDQVPKWLIPVTLPEKAPYRLWRIDYAAPEDAYRAPAGERHQPTPPPGRPSR